MGVTQRVRYIDHVPLRLPNPRSLSRRERTALVVGCIAGSLLINLGGVLAVIGLVAIEREAVEPEQMTVVELQPLEDLPEREPPPPPEPDKQPEPKPKPPKPPEPEPEPVLEEVPPEPEPEPEPEPVPEPEPELERPLLTLPNMKMVEQLDSLDEKNAPDDAEYLSNINRDVQEQTRAEITNLERDAAEVEASQLSPSAETTPGTSAEERIAELEQREAQLGRQAPPTPESPTEQRPQQTDADQHKQLAMREQAERALTEAQEEREDLAVEAEDGVVAAEQERSASVLPLEARAFVEGRDESYRFRVSRADMVAMFGDDLNARERVESQQRTEHKGVWDDARRRFQSPLENMVPEVQVGNQTALRSRKHPFARFIATIHRGIHERFAYGYLAQLDTRGRGHPLNDPGLWTRVEIVLLPSGEVEKVTTVHFSGNTEFDAAAREIVWAESPMPAPPSEIRSGNGKVYIHWAFHRNERACGTFGAQPFILDNAGQGDRPDPHGEIVFDAPARLERRLGHSGGGHGHGHTHEAPAARPFARGPEGPAPAGPNAGAPSRSSPSGASPSPSVAPPTATGSNSPRRSGGGTTNVAPPPGYNPNPPTAEELRVAQSVANAWIGGLASGSIRDMALRSSMPFYVGSTPAARSEQELRSLLENMVADARGAKIRPARVQTAAQLRGQFGSLPAGVIEGKDRVYVVATVGDDTFILLLESRFGRWRVVGFTR